MIIPAVRMGFERESFVKVSNRINWFYDITVGDLFSNIFYAHFCFVLYFFFTKIYLSAVTDNM